MGRFSELVKEVCKPMREDVTLGQLLDLYDLPRVSAARRLRIILAEDGFAVEGPAGSGVWAPFEDRTVAEVSVDHSTLIVNLREAEL